MILFVFYITDIPPVQPKGRFDRPREQKKGESRTVSTKADDTERERDTGPCMRQKQETSLCY